MSLLNQAIYAGSQLGSVFQELNTLSVTNDKHHSDNDQRDWMLNHANYHHDIP